MTTSGKVISILQREISKRDSGILFSVEITNISELNILVDDLDRVLSKFYSIVEKACEKVDEYHIIMASKPNKLFVIVPDRPKDAEKLAYSIYSQIQLYVDSEIAESYLQCSVGSIRFSKEQNLTAFDLLSRIAYGMQHSKEQGYYYCYDDNPLDVEQIRAENIRLNLLRSSLLEKKAKFMYQPIIDRATGEVEYHECLLRIPDENNNLISVGPIIADAERKGLINVVDFTVIEMAIKELEAEKDIVLSVNVSNIGVLNKRLLKRIEYLLKKYDVAERLIVEITETSLNKDFAATKKFIKTLHKHKVKFALDDFGSGFTSFKQLLNLPIDIIKIDGSYITDILENDHSKTFVEALIRLAGDLGIKSVAEFVENGEIAKFLIDIKVDGMQGNFFLPASSTRL